MCAPSRDPPAHVLMAKMITLVLTVAMATESVAVINHTDGDCHDDDHDDDHDDHDDHDHNKSI